MTDSSVQGIKTVLHPVSDLEKAKTVYTALLGIPRRWPTGTCRTSRRSWPR
jgi:hypothetical protein